MKNIFLVLHWASAAFLVLCLVVEFIVPFFLITKYVMPPEQSPGIFGYYAEDLWDEGRYPGFCVYSKKDEDGNLVVYMNQFQREAFLKDCNSTIDVARRTGVDISADYKTITVYQYAPDSVYYHLGLGLGAMPDCWSMQYINGEDFSDMYVDFFVKDAYTGEVCYHVNMPGDNIYVSFTNKYTFINGTVIDISTEKYFSIPPKE